MSKVAINGLGRIGRATFKIILDTPELECVAVNDLVPAETLAYLLKYDSVYGRFPRKVDHDSEGLIVDGNHYKLLNEKDPAALPWGHMGVEIAFECTGRFTNKDDLEKHVKAGAKHAILSAPSKGNDMATVIHGVNQTDGSVEVLSCASCTTNCIAPVAEIMDRRIGVEKAIMTTIHAYTSSQMIVDSPSKKVRRGRAGAVNLVPTSTGAAKATSKVLPQYENKFDGIAVRAPVPCGSVADLVFLTKRETSVEEVNEIFREEARSERYNGILGVADDPVVSSDIIQDSRASIVDAEMTQVVGGNLVKVLSWYDNEWGYSQQMVREAVALLKQA